MAFRAVLVERNGEWSAPTAFSPIDCDNALLDDDSDKRAYHIRLSFDGERFCERTFLERVAVANTPHPFHCLSDM